MTLGALYSLGAGYIGVLWFHKCMQCVDTKWQDTDQSGEAICKEFTLDKRLAMT